MDSTASDPQLKNRIFGAILLVILAVLLIPLFLGEPRSNIALSQQQQKKQFQFKIQPLPDSKEVIDVSAEGEDWAQQSDKATGALKKITLEPTAAESKAVAQQQNKPLSAAEETPEPKTAKGAKSTHSADQAKAVVGEGWALQAGIFSKQKNVDSLVKVLLRHGFKPTLSKTQAGFGEATRVWMGPFDSKEKAQQWSAKLKSINGNGGYIAPYPFK